MVKFTLIIAFLGLVALLSLAAIVLANAVMSKLFGQPIGGVVDWIRLIVANAVSACIPAVLAVRSNITIRFIGHIASKKVPFAEGADLHGQAISFLAISEFDIARINQCVQQPIDCRPRQSCCPVDFQNRGIIFFVKNAQNLQAALQSSDQTLRFDMSGFPGHPVDTAVRYR